MLTVHSIEEDEPHFEAGGSASRLAEMEAEMRKLREENRRLAEEKEDLHGQLLLNTVGKGKEVLDKTGPVEGAETSIDMEIMTNEEVRFVGNGNAGQELCDGQKYSPRHS